MNASQERIVLLVETKEYLKRTLGILSKRRNKKWSKNVEARTRSPLRIRAPNKVIDFSIGDQAQSV